MQWFEALDGQSQRNFVRDFVTRKFKKLIDVSTDGKSQSTVGLVSLQEGKKSYLATGLNK